ncbi:hypothetical protein U879_01890 [Defluviimonas sp. 20V17]|uniref:Uncharacterized protein n=1 Tax=Allgaiera indica TaxID=765699 RepID=A0AAN5A0I8_9RHOB|nr:hypothetical protein [Allgaiera indica]KDB05389.1 hypothetical protein U879_01890 [Defluviimonas sp. 20V17]GHE04190.1 hypothetical protein GCM10008024_30430 [Allgaiera indica]SDX50798.1 hypothetical protein SAMN05444006_11860 [Allgaiera indica]
MGKSPSIHLALARDFTRMAGQWLTLIRFSVHGNAPVFSPSVSLYHDMLDPNAEDGARLKACRTMLTLVDEQVLMENRCGREAYARDRPVDPYGRHWRTTERGAALAALSSLLAGAIGAFAAAEKNGKS